VWGISRRQAQRLAGRAHLVLVEDLEGAGVERKALVAQLRHGLMEAMSRASKSNQPAVVVGCARAISDLLQLSVPPADHEQPEHPSVLVQEVSICRLRRPFLH